MGSAMNSMVDNVMAKCVCVDPAQVQAQSNNNNNPAHNHKADKKFSGEHKSVGDYLDEDERSMSKRSRSQSISMASESASTSCGSARSDDKLAYQATTVLAKNRSNQTDTDTEDEKRDNSSFRSASLDRDTAFLSPQLGPRGSNSFSRSASAVEPLPSDLLTLSAQKEQENRIPTNNKVMMSCANLLAVCIQDYFQSDASQCEFGAIDVEGILQHILITGDAPRDYVLGIEMERHLDILIDTRSLTELVHLRHLNKYHSTRERQESYSQCLLWNHYLNKLESDGAGAAQARKAAPDVSQCDYVLNAKLFASIIMQSSVFENKLSVYCDTSHRYPIFYMQIIDTLQYNQFNLDGCNFTFLDHHQRMYKPLLKDRVQQRLNSTQPAHVQCHQEKRHKLNQSKKENEPNSFMERQTSYFEKNLHMRLSTRRANDGNFVFSEAGNEGDENTPQIRFEIPVYRWKVSECVANFDHALNFLLLPFSAIVTHLIEDGFASFLLNANRDEDNSQLSWKGKMVNAVLSHDVFGDLERKMIAHPHPQRILKLYKRPQLNFWRLVKLGVLCGGAYSVDGKLIAAHKKYYKTWIDSDAFLQTSEKPGKDSQNDVDATSSDDKSKAAVAVYRFNELLRTMFAPDLCASWLDFQNMLKMFAMLEFDAVLIRQLKRGQHFKQDFLRHLQEQDQDVTLLFAARNYPTS